MKLTPENITRGFLLTPIRSHETDNSIDEPVADDVYIEGADVSWIVEGWLGKTLEVAAHAWDNECVIPLVYLRQFCQGYNCDEQGLAVERDAFVKGALQLFNHWRGIGADLVRIESPSDQFTKRNPDFARTAPLKVDLAYQLRGSGIPAHLAH